jgi:hypothetical protein
LALFDRARHRGVELSKGGRIDSELLELGGGGGVRKRRSRQQGAENDREKQGKQPSWGERDEAHGCFVAASEARWPTKRMACDDSCRLRATLG